MEPTPAPIPPHWTSDEVTDRVVVEGPDALDYLQSQVSQDLRGLTVGSARWSFVLDPTGKILGFARVERNGDDQFQLRTDPGAGAGLLERLDRFKIRVRAETRLIPATAPVEPEAEESRIRVGWPRFGHDLEPGRTVPAETGLSAIAVSTTKGCYPGQELVERMDSRAAVAPRSLRRVTVEPGTMVGVAVVDADGAEVGTITSVAGTDAIASVKRGAEVGHPVEPPAH